MKISIQSTNQFVEASGVRCRIWEGKTERGIPITVLVPRIAVANAEDTSQFEAELQEQSVPRPALDAFPLRMIL